MQLNDVWVPFICHIRLSGLLVASYWLVVRGLSRYLATSGNGTIETPELSPLILLPLYLVTRSSWLRIFALREICVIVPTMLRSCSDFF